MAALLNAQFEQRFSSYQLAKSYKNGVWWADGIVNPRSMSHCSTAIKNADGTLTQAFLALDLDVAGTSPEFIDEKGRIDYLKIKNLLKVQFSFIDLDKEFLGGWRSPSGGIHLWFCLPPFQLNNDKFESNLRLFKACNHFLIELFQKLGVNADPSAFGVNRLFRNFRHTPGIEPLNNRALSRIWNPDNLRTGKGRWKRENVMSRWLIGLRENSYLKYQPKKKRAFEENVEGHRVVFDADGRVEPRIARLCYTVAMEFEGHWQGPMSALVDLSGIADTTLYRRLGKKYLSGLEMKKADGEISVSFTASSQLYVDEMHRLMSVKSSFSGPKVKPVGLIPPDQIERPEKVNSCSEGRRNKWLLSVGVYLKFYGLNLEASLNVMRPLIPKIPNASISKAVKNWEKKLKNIFTNYQHTTGCREADLSILPYWLKPRETNTPPIFQEGLSSPWAGSSGKHSGDLLNGRLRLVAGCSCPEPDV